MAEPHKGRWEVVPDGECPNLGGIEPLDAQQKAVHMFIIHPDDPINPDKWKVLYFQPRGEGPEQYMRSRIWNKNSDPPISSQDIPDWPGGPPPPGGDWKGRLFCSGHVYLDEGKLLVAGGHRHPVEYNLWARGMPFTYIFNNQTDQWEIAGGVSNPRPMADGRWYPTLVRRGLPPNEKKVLAFSGYRFDYRPVPGPTQLWFNERVEIYDPDP